MDKTISYSIPDELWVNNFSENKTANFTYSGPETIFLVADLNSNIFITTTDSRDSFSGQENQYRLIEVDILTAPDKLVMAAIVLNSKVDSTPNTFVDEVNHDGSIYSKIENPKACEYYEVILQGIDTVDLRLIVKSTDNPNLQVAKERKKYVETYSSTYEFTGNTSTLISEFLVSINNYIAVIEKAYPWKYITYNSNEIPKIPAELVSVFNAMPVIQIP